MNSDRHTVTRAHDSVQLVYSSESIVKLITDSLTKLAMAISIDIYT